MDDDTDVLFRVWEDQRTQARHAEAQRATITNYIFTISAAIIAFLSQKGLNRDSLILSCFLIALGLYGMVCCYKLHKLWELNTGKARALRGQIDKLHPNSGLESLNSEARKDHKDKNPIIFGVTLNHIWSTLNSIIALVGFIFVIQIYKIF